MIAIQELNRSLTSSWISTQV